MQGTEFVEKATVCFAIGCVNISTINSSVVMSFWVCDQNII